MPLIDLIIVQPKSKFLKIYVEKNTRDRIEVRVLVDLAVDLAALKYLCNPTLCLSPTRLRSPEFWWRVALVLASELLRGGEEQLAIPLPPRIAWRKIVYDLLSYGVTGVNDFKSPLPKLFQFLLNANQTQLDLISGIGENRSMSDPRSQSDFPNGRLLEALLTHDGQRGTPDAIEFVQLVPLPETQTFRSNLAVGQRLHSVRQ